MYIFIYDKFHPYLCNTNLTHKFNVTQEDVMLIFSNVMQTCQGKTKSLRKTCLITKSYIYKV